MDILSMRKIEVRDGNLTIKEKVEMVYEKRITPFGNSAKLDAPRKYRGWRAYVVIVGEK
jgi:putative transposon-encoded protein